MDDKDVQKATRSGISLDWRRGGESLHGLTSSANVTEGDLMRLSYVKA